MLDARCWYCNRDSSENSGIANEIDEVILFFLFDGLLLSSFII